MQIIFFLWTADAFKQHEYRAAEKPLLFLFFSDQGQFFLNLYTVNKCINQSQWLCMKDNAQYQLKHKTVHKTALRFSCE